MALQLKGLWRNLVRSNYISLTRISSNASEVMITQSEDPLLESITSASNTSQVLAIVQQHGKVMTQGHMLQAMRTLFELHKSGKFEGSMDNLVRDPGFSSLCQNINRLARNLDINEAVDAIKVLSYLHIPVDTLIVQTMLQIIRCHINTINVRQIMFLDFLLKKFDKENHLVDALKLALPLVFQIHLPMELDHEDLPLLKDMLVYCCTHNLPAPCINTVVTGLLLHSDTIDAKTAKSIVWALCEVNCTEEVFPMRAHLLQLCNDILAKSLNDLSYNDVLKLTLGLKTRIVEKHPEFYHEPLMDAVADYVIQSNVEFEKGILIAKALSKIAHTHLGLVDYLCNIAASSPDCIANARVNILLGFVNFLSNNNHVPELDQWTEIKKQISLNPILECTNSELPWTKLCLELASLGYYDDNLLKQVFSQEFLDDYLNRTKNHLDYLQLLTFQEAVNTFHSEEYKMPSEVLEKAKELYPVHSLTLQLEESISRGLGSTDYIVKNVVLPSGIIADIMLCLKGGYPIKLPRFKDNRVPIEKLDVPSDVIRVCVMNFNQGCFSMNSNRLRGTFRLILDILEKKGYIAVPVNINEWLNAPAHERTPFLMREIGYKCGEIGMKLCTT